MSPNIEEEKNKKGILCLSTLTDNDKEDGSCEMKNGESWETSWKANRTDKKKQKDVGITIIKGKYSGLDFKIFFVWVKPI